MRSGRAAPAKQLAARADGFTYVWVLATLVVLSVGLAAIGPMWAQDAQRDRERELLRIGSLYAEAIAAYRESSPGALRQWPSSLDDLLLDTRYAGTVRHLRRLYPDPLDPSRPWGLVKAPEGGIRGVFSQSNETPLRREALRVGSVMLLAAERYEQWKFTPESMP